MSTRVAIEQAAPSAAAGVRDPSARPLLALGDTLPSAPHVVSRLVSLTDADADTRDLLATIDRDPALTARILRTANSPFYAQNRSVTSVTRAVVVLGLPMVRNLTLGLTVWDATTSHISPHQARRLWDHSLAVAQAARHFAVATRSCLGPDAFTAGLLHDVGKLVLARQFPEDYRSLLGQTTMTRLLPELERAAVGYDHAEVGALLFERWRLPRIVVDAVARHHDASPSPGLPGFVAAANALVGCAPDEREAALARAAAAGVDAELWREYVERSASDAATP